MIRYGILAGAMVLGASAMWSQQLTLGPLTDNGQLQWADFSTPFIKANAYTVEWAARLNGTQTVWNVLTTVPATNTAYSLDVPRFFRLRAEVFVIPGEPFVGQKTLFPDYVLDDYLAVSQLFASYGMKIVFTGHFHGQDVVRANTGNSPLYDIETGSTATYPCPYRLIDLDTQGNLAITSHPITAINYDLGGVDFPTYAAEFLHTGLLGISTYLLMSPPYNLSSTQAQSLAPALAEAVQSHYQGDEGSRPISAQAQGTIADLRSLGDPLSQMMANSLVAIFTDLPPADNNLRINLVTGDGSP